MADSVVPMEEEIAALRAEVRRLRAEAARLTALLKMAPAEAGPPGPSQTSAGFPGPGPVISSSPAEAKVQFFAALFTARTDAYAVRWTNARTGRAGWAPALAGG